MIREHKKLSDLCEQNAQKLIDSIRQNSDQNNNKMKFNRKNCKTR